MGSYHPTARQVPTRFTVRMLKTRWLFNHI